MVLVVGLNRAPFCNRLAFSYALGGFVRLSFVPRLGRVLETGLLLAWLLLAGRAPKPERLGRGLDWLMRSRCPASASEGSIGVIRSPLLNPSIDLLSPEVVGRLFMKFFDASIVSGEILVICLAPSP